MGTIGNQGFVPPLKQPADLSQLDKSQIQQQAQQIKTENPDMPFTESEIVDQLTYMKQNGIELAQSHVDKLQSGSPVIPKPRLDVLFQSQSANELSNLSKYKMLRANPIALYFAISLDMAALLSKIKVTEAEEAGEAIMQMYETAKEIAQQIEEMGQLEAIAHFVSAAMTVASAAISLGGAMAMKGKSEMGSRRIQMMSQSASQLPTAIDGIVKGVIALKKSVIEGEKVMNENLMKTMERKLQAAIDSYRTNDELIQQTLQNVQKVQDEAYRAHGWSTR